MDSSVRKQVLRSISNGMYVVTAGTDDALAGATITWLTQCSFEPPLLVAGVRGGSGLHEVVRRTMAAVVHVLDRGQQDLAARFFKPATVEDGLINGLEFEETGSGPLLTDALAWAECRVREIVDCGGDHDLMVLEVVDVGARGEVDPLTVWDSPWSYGG